MNREEATRRLLDAAEAEFYEHGIQAVGMAAIRERSGVSLKRLYQCFPAKEDLVLAYLSRRDLRWLDSLADHVTANAATPAEAVLAVFDWLHLWFAEDGFHGCAFINSFGELGSTSPVIAEAGIRHKDRLREYLRDLVSQLEVTDVDKLTDQLFSLVEGATVIAGMSGRQDIALSSKAAAATLLEARLPSAR
ncbi:TetR family transcriptional regulator [Prauserella marina]|uniref:DNA-binding transcriptional regulator, AcrR family n=1 Tax=Prauserella marina TaxID=530584 RepID=A0A222VUG8_9PSEU|nr:TetR/AcrR family transcriptional regulator [Prauserella marina]ASR37576.1 TetR family transcriptional regulator [Prauserella marina]PWV75481.1 TetR family transcriptional regulator [Prauserella marina]SDD33577.1 DNA-binding transcriptional regulator, AcrR family [Prauserella marina]